MALALKRLPNPPDLVLPESSAREAALVKGLRIYSARHLLDIVRALLKSNSPMLVPLPLAVPETVELQVGSGPDLRDVKGQSGAKRALEVAAAGGHSVLMVGPPGTGKSMLAQRFVHLLPPLEEQQALESAAVLSLAGYFQASRWAQRPFRSPHHSASSVALVGGGSPPRPGEISLAHQGVLFMDELPEYSRQGLEALREPLETGLIVISRAARQAEFPARFQLIAAMNPCPCGHLGSRLKSCRCSPEMVARYQGRLSGPLLDRIDVQIEVPAVAIEALAEASEGESTAVVAARVAQAQQLQRLRQGNLNQLLQGDALDQHAGLAPAAKNFLQDAARRLGWSARGFHRVLRLARTVADLGASPTIETPHLAEAIQYRRVLKNE